MQISKHIFWNIVHIQGICVVFSFLAQKIKRERNETQGGEIQREGRKIQALEKLERLLCDLVLKGTLQFSDAKKEKMDKSLQQGFRGFMKELNLQRALNEKEDGNSRQRNQHEQRHQNRNKREVLQQVHYQTLSTPQEPNRLMHPTQPAGYGMFYGQSQARILQINYYLGHQRTHLPVLNQHIFLIHLCPSSLVNLLAVYLQKIQSQRGKCKSNRQKQYI